MQPAPMKFLLALCAIALFSVSISGCAQRSIAQKTEGEPGGVQPGNVLPGNVQSESVLPRNVQSEDCRSCHASNGAVGAEDFSAIFTDPKSHHPVGVAYPLAAEGNPNFSLPNGQRAEVMFFDRNGNGQPDSDEIMLFGANGLVTVECATCHKEHVGLPLSSKGHAGFYLRVANTGSALCTTCHLK